MKTLGVEELREHLNEVLRQVEEEGETIEVTKQGKVIARVVPERTERRPLQTVERTPSEVWAEIDRVAAEISAHWPANVSAVDAVRDVRNE